MVKMLKMAETWNWNITEPLVFKAIHFHDVNNCDPFQILKDEDGKDGGNVELEHY